VLIICTVGNLSKGISHLAHIEAIIPATAAIVIHTIGIHGGGSDRFVDLIGVICDELVCTGCAVVIHSAIIHSVIGESIGCHGFCVSG